MFSPEYRKPTPPEWWPLWKMEIFYKQPFKLQYFIFLKYTKKWPKNWIRKFMFISSESTYYRYDHLAKDLVNEVYK